MLGGMLKEKEVGEEFVNNGQPTTVLKTTDDGRFICESKNLRSSEKYLCIDFEAMTEGENNNHRVNFARTEDFSGEIKEEHDTIQEFMHFLLQRDGETGKFVFNGYTVIAHYGSGYDFRFIYEYIVRHTDLKLHTIFDGNKITYMSVANKLKLRFVDSFKHTLQPLAKLPKMFGLKELKKGFFPHKFNNPQNQDYEGPYPPAKFYDPNGMKKEIKEEFDVWHALRTKDHLVPHIPKDCSDRVVEFLGINRTFNFQNELKEYCRSDVDILRRTCMALRESFMKTENIDPFQYTTLPATTMALYRANHMPSKSIAVFRESRDNQSAVAMEWLRYMAKVNRCAIHTALDGPEAKITVVRRGVEEEKKVDGLCGNDVYEFSGCYFHGCPKCFPGRREKYERTVRHNNEITNAGYTLHHIWECEWRDMKKDESNSKVVEDMNDLPLNPREAFFGGRTEAYKTYFNCRRAQKAYKIYYKDFTSLYPWVQYNCEYPKGHPTKIRENFDYSLESYFGLIKCKVQPPRKLYHSVLPRRTERLLFDLGGEKNEPIVGTWMHAELLLAMKKGYKILEIYEVHHFEHTTKDLFRSYIKQFLKIKQESSGWGDDVTTEAEKDAYIQYYAEKQGIDLTGDNISENEGMRAFSKLCLNNLWGRFGMRVFNDDSQICRNHQDVLDVFSKPNIVQDSITFDVYEDGNFAVANYHTVGNDHTSSDSSTNIYIAVFTTAWARIRLYEEGLDKLGERVLYCDTDSVIYYGTADEDFGLDEGKLLGQFTDELHGHTAWCFGSGGPKNYCMENNKLENCPQNKKCDRCEVYGKECPHCKHCKHCGASTCKVKGFSLTHGNSENINFEKMIDAVCKASRGETHDKLEANNFRIRYDAKARSMKSFSETKEWSYCLEKRNVCRFSKWCIDSLPFGY